MTLRRWLSGCALGLGLGLSGTVLAQAARAELEQQRRAVQAHYERELQACQMRFVVTACIDEARLRRRVADAPLREALLQMDDQDRQQRAAQRRRVVAEKQREAAARLAEPPASAPLSAATGLARPERGAVPQQPALPGAGETEEARQREAAARAEAAARQREAQRRREQSEAAQARVLRRLQERQTQRRPATPLPVPASPAATPAATPATPAASAAGR